MKNNKKEEVERRICLDLDLLGAVDAVMPNDDQQGEDSSGERQVRILFVKANVIEKDSKYDA